ncbi:TPA_asm: hypothetical protein G0D46_16410 [Salmonella enterica subsp. enterica serovar Java]|nr:hypothetical protein [Salmonella enterica]ECI2266548.1 hypothetical protein [Salmonella enterica subsp. enterica serovar Wandsworth]HAC6880223.1 hypothetical protein [Salmonella enterica subsp. enterica serovar Java]
MRLTINIISYRPFEDLSLWSYSAAMAPHGDPEFIAKEAHSEYTEFYQRNQLYLLKIKSWR